MKKIIITISIITCMLFSTAVSSFAGTNMVPQVLSDIELRYTHFTRATLVFDVSSGTADCILRMPLKSDQTIDYGTITATIKKSSGTTVKTFTEKVYPKAGMWSWSDSYTLTSRGDYYLNATVKCYRNGALVETISKESNVMTY